MTNTENYTPSSCLTANIIEQVMSEFNWPLEYEIEEDDEQFNTFIIKFSTCEIELYDVPEDGIHLTFLTYDSGKELDADYSDIVYLKCINNYKPSEHLNIEFNEYKDKVDDIKKMVRNKMKNLQYYHLDFIKGEDYTWVKKYLQNKHKL